MKEIEIITNRRGAMTNVGRNKIKIGQGVGKIFKIRKSKNKKDKQGKKKEEVYKPIGFVTD